MNGTMMPNMLMFSTSTYVFTYLLVI